MVVAFTLLTQQPGFEAWHGQLLSRMLLGQWGVLKIEPIQLENCSGETKCPKEINVGENMFSTYSIMLWDP